MRICDWCKKPFKPDFTSDLVCFKCRLKDAMLAFIMGCIVIGFLVWFFGMNPVKAALI